MVNLYFDISGESGTDRALLASRVETAVANISLETEQAFHTAVNDWLDRITGQLLQKRRLTAQAIAESAINPSLSKEAVFKRSGVVTKGIFYSRKKDWLYNQEYRFILEVLVAIYRKWEAGAALREMMDRQAAWREVEHGRATRLNDVTEKMIIKMEEMLSILQLEEVDIQGEKGEAITIKPANADFNTVARFATAVAGASAQSSKLARLALNMDTDQTTTNVQAEVEQVDAGAIRETMEAKLRDIGIRLRRPSPNEPEEDEEDHEH